MFRVAYEQGVQAALYKYAGFASGALRSLAASPNLKRNLNIAGLGMIAAPTVHNLVSGEDNDSPTVHSAKHMSDLAGLGLLIGTEFMKH